MSGNPNHNPKSGEFASAPGASAGSGVDHHRDATAAEHQKLAPAMIAPTARLTGFPKGGYYALDAQGQTMRGNAKYGEMPPSYKTFEKAHAVAMKAR